jgi:hypothetical protein
VLLACPQHRDKTRVQMPIFPHLKVKCQLFMGPTLGFDTKQRNSFLIKFGAFVVKSLFTVNMLYFRY